MATDYENFPVPAAGDETAARRAFQNIQLRIRELGGLNFDETPTASGTATGTIIWPSGTSAAAPLKFWEITTGSDTYYIMGKKKN